jgi:hypothetical protein
MSYKTDKKPDHISETQPNRRGGPPKGSTNAKKHGHYSRKAALMQIGFDGIDKRTAAGRELALRREAIYMDLGGKVTVSQIKSDLVERYMRLCILIDSLDSWLFAQPTLINKRKRTLLPIVRERAQLEDTALRLANAIGLERRTKSVDIVSALAEIAREDAQEGEHE